MRYLRNQYGEISMVIVALVMATLLAATGVYVYNARIQDKSGAGSAVSVEKNVSVPAAIKADADASVANTEGDAADKVDVSDSDAEDSDLD